jgi:hypothetical protein
MKESRIRRREEGRGLECEQNKAQREGEYRAD